MARKTSAKKKLAKKKSKSKKQSKKRRLIVKAITVSQASVDADVRESVKHVTGVINSTKIINSKYLAKGTWLGDADDIEKRLVVVHGYATFRLNDDEAGKYYDKSFNAFIIYCRGKILGA